MLKRTKDPAANTEEDLEIYLQSTTVGQGIIFGLKLTFGM